MKFKNKMVLLLIFSLLLALLRPILYANTDIYDAQYYATMVEFFRGNADLFSVPSAWRVRLLVPFLASIIPIDAYNALNIVSLIFNLLSVYYFYKFLSFFKFTEKLQTLGTFIYIIAAPTIVLGFVPLTDSAGMFFTIFILYLYYKNPKIILTQGNLKSYMIFSCVIGIGVLARETVIFTVPIIILWQFIDRKIPWKNITSLKQLKQPLILVIGIGLIPIIVYLSLTAFIGDLTLKKISITRLIENFQDLFDERTLATIAQLVFLILISIYGCYQLILNRDPMIWKLIIGVGGFIIPFIIAFLFADMSFRFFWPFFVFIIPIFLHGITRLN